MTLIKPFKALRPDNSLASEVASLPYDVMNSSEAAAMCRGNENSFLHVSRAEIDLPDGTDEHAEAVYQKAKENFAALISKKILVQDEKEYYYLYAQTMNGRTQTGIVACSSIDDYFNNVIKKHEFTRPEKEKDRIAHMISVQTHVGPIFLTFRPNEKLSAIIKKTTGLAPEVSFTAEDGVKHEVWTIKNDAQIREITEIFSTEIPCTYIADGHHRTASAAKVGKMLRDQTNDHEAEFNYFLSVLFPSDQLYIMDYNRLIKDLNGLSTQDFISKVSELFSITKTDLENVKPKRLHQFGLYIENQWYTLEAKPEIVKQDPIGVLDVSILQENILSPLLGIADPRTDKRIDFVGGIRGIAELQKRVDSGDMKIAFVLFPVSIEQLMEIADTDNVMPPKSTWFEPKLRDGLFCHLF